MLGELKSSLYKSPEVHIYRLIQARVHHLLSAGEELTIPLFFTWAVAWIS